MSPGNAQQIIKQANKVRHVNVNHISIESIDYNNENSARKFAFLYLSDCVCSYLDYEVQEEFLENTLTTDIVEQLPAATKDKLLKKNPGTGYSKSIIKKLSNTDARAIAAVVKKDLNEEYAIKIRTRIKNLNQNPENMFYYYDDVDTCYETALKSALQGQLFETLSAIYEGRYLFKGNIKRYYTKKWYPIVEDLLEKTCGKDTYSDALQKAVTYRMNNNISPGCLLYIFEALEKRKDQLPDKAAEYSLYDLGISAYTHVGNPYKAEECFERCLELSKYVEDSDLCATKNRMITVYNDLFRFKDAEGMAAGALGINIEGYNQRSKSGIRRFAEYIKSLFVKKMKSAS